MNRYQLLPFAFCFFALLVFAGNTVSGQQTEATPAPGPTPKVQMPLGPGDTLSLSVKGLPDMDWTGEVDVEGNLTLPFIDKPIAAACRTLQDVTQDIKAGYGKFLKNHEEITVKLTNRASYHSPVTVYGAVKTPARIQLLRPNVRLPEVLAAAGGLTEKAKTLVILPTQKSWCDENSPRKNIELGWSLAYKLDEALGTDEEHSLQVFPGDTIIVFEKDVVYVAGEVAWEGALVFTEGLTFSEAIAKSGGFSRDARRQRIFIRRSENGHGARTEIKVNVEAIRTGKEADIQLLPNDVIVVPGSPNWCGDGTPDLMRFFLSILVRNRAMFPLIAPRVIR